MGKEGKEPAASEKEDPKGGIRSMGAPDVFPSFKRRAMKVSTTLLFLHTFAKIRDNFPVRAKVWTMVVSKRKRV